MNRPEYEDWDGYTYTTTEAIAIHFGITFSGACHIGLDDLTDEDYDAIMVIRKKLEDGIITFKSDESRGYI